MTHPRPPSPMQPKGFRNPLLSGLGDRPNGFSGNPFRGEPANGSSHRTTRDLPEGTLLCGGTLDISTGLARNYLQNR
jgi:hypothetical protein